MTKATLGAGDVSFTLAGEERTLRPTLGAARAASRLNGGIMAAVQAIAQFDFDVLVRVLALGLDEKVSDIEDAVYSDGVANLAPHAITFLTNLANGGRPVSEDGGSGKGNPPKKGD